METVLDDFAAIYEAAEKDWGALSIHWEGERTKEEEALHQSLFRKGR